MNIITVHPADMDQETAIKLFLDALHVSYKATDRDIDETQYLESSPAMKEHLEKAAKQERNNEGTIFSL